MLKADHTRSIAESVRERIGADLRAKKEFEEKSAQDFKNKLSVLFEYALVGKAECFFAEDQFTTIQLKQFSEAGFDVSYQKANRKREENLCFNINETRSILDRFLNKLTDHPGILKNIFPGYMAAPSAFLNLLEKYWSTNKLSRSSCESNLISGGLQLINLLLEHNKDWSDDLFEASSLLDQITENFIRLKAFELDLREISSKNGRVPDGVDSGILISLNLWDYNLDWNNKSLFSPSWLSWVSSEDGQIFIRKLEQLISHEAHEGKMEAGWYLYDQTDRWIADYFEYEDRDYWVDNLGMVHDDAWADDEGMVHFKDKEGDEFIVVPPPPVFAEILNLTGYKAETIWKPPIINEDGEEEEDGDEVWDARISVSW